MIPTPHLLVDAATVRANISRLADYACTHGIGVRPHTKTHKSRMLAKLQMDAGAIGLAAAKAGEAEIMAEVSDDILLAYPVVDMHRAGRIAELAGLVTVRVAIDSDFAADVLSGAARITGTEIGVLVDADVGLGRTGVQSPDDALRLARVVDRSRGLRLDGIMIYPGHVWAPKHAQEEPLAEVAGLLEAVLTLWREAGLKAEIISGGSTPTAFQSHLIPQVTEIRPGTYIFNDMNTAHGGYCTLEDCAARIVTTVISTAVPGQVVIDAGNKTLAMDRCLPAPESGHGYVVEYPEARITALSEELAQVDVSRCDSQPALGERISVIPNHICPVVNLQDSFYWADGGEAVQMPVDTRGKLW